MADNPGVVFTAPEEARLEDRAVPEPEGTEVLVEATRSLVSTGTELTIYSGEYPEGSTWDEYGTYPFDAGYCNVGEVVEVGPDLEEEWVGRTVATRTPHRKYATADVESSPVVRVPDGVDDDVATLFAIAGIVMNGVRRGEVSWGDDVAVFGVGLLGQLATRFAAHAGARSVAAFDLADDRLDYLPDEPGVVAANPDESEPSAVVEDATGGKPADVVFEVTGLPGAVVDQFEVLRNRGRFVVLSSPRGETTLDLHDHCNDPSYEIVGAHEMSHPPERDHQWAYDDYAWTHRRHYELFFDLVADGRLDAEELISHRVPYEEAPETYEWLLADRTEAMGVVFEW